MNGNHLALQMLCCLFAAVPSVASAAEGGDSVYLQGTYNDFASAIAGPPGLYLRNDIFVYDAGKGPRPLGR